MLEVIEHSKFAINRKNLSQVLEQIGNCTELTKNGLTYCWYYYAPDEDTEFSSCMCLETGKFFSNRQLVEMGLIDECFADNTSSPNLLLQ